MADKSKTEWTAALASIMLGRFLGSPARHERGAYMAGQVLADFRQVDSCPMPRKNQIILSAAAPLECSEPARVLTAVPMQNKQTGELVTVPQKLCIEHSIEAASWKLIYAILEDDRAARKERRIIPGTRTLLSVPEP